MEHRQSDDLPGWMLDGTVYPSEAAYQAALDKRDARRARVMELIAVRERWEAANPGEAWHGPGGDER